MPRRSTLKPAEAAAEPDVNLMAELQAKFERYQVFMKNMVGRPSRPWDEPWDNEWNLYYISRTAKDDRDRIQASRILLEYLRPKVKSQEVVKPKSDNDSRVEIIVRR